MFSFNRRPPRQVTLYTRAGCHLCDDARLLLEHLSRRHRLVVHEIDISAHPDLVRRYDLLIPVVVIGDVELTAPIHERDVRRILSCASPPNT